DFVDAFREGLSETGYVEGRNVTIQFRWAEGHEDRLPALAGDLVARQVAVIAVTGGLHPAVVAKAATSIIPIVFTGGGDPEKLGLVASLARPGANATGAINFSPVVTAKRLELFRQLLPTGSTIAVLSNPTDPNNEVAVREGQEAAPSTGQLNHIVNTGDAGHLDAAFARIIQNTDFRPFVNVHPLFTTP